MIASAIITGIATLAATLLAVYLTPIVTSKKHRSRHNIPNIVATWQATWFIDEDLYAEDIVVIPGWKKKNHFVGNGRSVNGTYSLFGQIDSARIAVGTYEDDKYPTRGLIGTFVLKLSMDAQSMTGYWNGLAADGELSTGTVEWRRMDKTV